MTAATMEPVDSGGKTEKVERLWGSIEIPILGITGEKFTGKSLFASSIDPEHTCMIDGEDSTESYNIPFAERVSLYDEMLQKHKGPASPLQVWTWFIDFVGKIEPGKFTVLAVDPFTDFQSGLVEWVKANGEKFGHSKNQYEKASGLLWMDVKSHLKMLLGILSRKVQTFVFISHMGNVFKGGAPTDKRQAKGLDTLFELSSLYLELERKPDAKGKISAKPSAKVLKSRLALSSFVDGEWVHKPILPPRLDVATPAEIRKWIKNPPDYDKLKPNQLIQEEVLSEDDKLLLQREIVSTQLEVEQAKLSGLELIKQQTERQAELRMKQAAAAAAVQKPESVKSQESPPAVQSATEQPAATTTAINEATVTTSEAAEDPKPTVYQIIEAQRKQLGVSESSWLAALAKRNCKTTAELTPEQAEEIRINLWGKLTKQDMARATVSAKNSGSPATTTASQTA